MEPFKKEGAGEEATRNNPPPSSSVALVRQEIQRNVVRNYMEQTLERKYGERPCRVERPVSNALDELSLDGFVRFIQSGYCKNIITMAGAGLSTSAGIPDYRSPGSGLYHNLRKFNLPEPHSIFDINYFRKNPMPFFTVAKELLPGKFKPTVAHYFIRLLQEKGLLRRHYTQNIDTLERISGLSENHLVEAHGSFHESLCIICKRKQKIEWNKYLNGNQYEYNVPICTYCPGIVKPDIVFFNEKLPERFYNCVHQDFQTCDLLIIMGSSLEVQPFSSLIDLVDSWVPRLLINRERVGVSTIDARTRDALNAMIQKTPELASVIGLSPTVNYGGLQFDSPDNARDFAWLGDCDQGCQELANKLGWGDELRYLVRGEHRRIDRQRHAQSSSMSLMPQTHF